MFVMCTTVEPNPFLIWDQKNGCFVDFEASGYLCCLESQPSSTQNKTSWAALSRRLSYLYQCNLDQISNLIPTDQSVCLERKRYDEIIREAKKVQRSSLESEGKRDGCCSLSVDPSVEMHEDDQVSITRSDRLRSSGIQIGIATHSPAPTTRRMSTDRTIRLITGLDHSLENRRESLPNSVMTSQESPKSLEKESRISAKETENSLSPTLDGFKTRIRDDVSTQSNERLNTLTEVGSRSLTSAHQNMIKSSISGAYDENERDRFHFLPSPPLNSYHLNRRNSISAKDERRIHPSTANARQQCWASDRDENQFLGLEEGKTRSFSSEVGNDSHMTNLFSGKVRAKPLSSNQRGKSEPNLRCLSQVTDLSPVLEGTESGE